MGKTMITGNLDLKRKVFGLYEDNQPTFIWGMALMGFESFDPGIGELKFDQFVIRGLALEEDLIGERMYKMHEIMEQQTPFEIPELDRPKGYRFCITSLEIGCPSEKEFYEVTLTIKGSMGLERVEPEG